MIYEIAEQWAHALKSGEYKQGTGVLHRRSDTGDTFCCLGVLCKVAQKHAVHLDTQEEDDGQVIAYGRQDDWHSGTLPRIVQDWAGVYSDLGAPRNDQMENSLVAMNDGLGKSFNEIADYILANYKDL